MYGEENCKSDTGGENRLGLNVCAQLNKHSILDSGAVSAACTGELMVDAMLQNTARIINFNVLGSKESPLFCWSFLVTFNIKSLPLKSVKIDHIKLLVHCFLIIMFLKPGRVDVESGNYWIVFYIIIRIAVCLRALFSM